MRGRPVLEGILMFLVLGALVLPVRRLGRDEGGQRLQVPELPQVQEGGDHQQEIEGVVVFRSSSPLKSVEVRQGKALRVVLPAEGQGELEWEEDVVLLLEHGKASMVVTVAWQDPTPEQAYCELTFEPDGMEARRFGVWGDGETKEFQELSWPHPH